MSRKEILTGLNEIIRKYDKHFSDYDNDLANEELQIDDLSKVQVVMEVERKFGVEFDILDMHKIRSVKDLVDFIEKLTS